MTDWLSTDEAAARLGVKRQTLYAYVSRGLVHREMDLDGRSSRFDPVEIDRLRGRAKRTASGELNTIIASRVTRLSQAGHEYRGQLAGDLARRGATFESVADLLWDDSGRWPEPMQPRSVSDESSNLAPLDQFRIAVARASSADPLRADQSRRAVAAAGRSIINSMVDALPPLGDEHESGAIAGRLWSRLTSQVPTQPRLHALNAALVLLADHGLAASTFAVRIAASVRADPYSAVSTGLGALGGQLHGAASGNVQRLFERAVALGSEHDAMGELLGQGLRIPGIGHTIYDAGDPRELALHELMTTSWEGESRVDILNSVRSAGAERAGRLPNIDFALGALTWLADAEPDAGMAIFAIARTAGWLAHAMEEATEPALRFRAEARYLPT